MLNYNQVYAIHKYVFYGSVVCRQVIEIRYVIYGLYAERHLPASLLL